MSKDNPVSPKVIAATAGAGAGSILSTFVVWLLGVLVWDAPANARQVDAAIGAVPAPVTAVIGIALTAVLAGLPGWKVTDPHRVTPEELRHLHQREDPPDEVSRAAGAADGRAV